jgi:Tol biopolymer transport system component
LLHEETQDRFFSAVNTTANALSPNRKWLLFTADTTGWDQIYVMPALGGPVTQLTKTPGDHWRAVWSHDGTRIAWDTNTKDAPGDRHIEVATIDDDPSKAVVTAVTSGKGTNISAQWSPTTRACSINTPTSSSPRNSTSRRSVPPHRTRPFD